MESYFRRWASVDGSVMSFTATIRRPELPCAARNTLRPIRPNPLMPTVTANWLLLYRLDASLAAAFEGSVAARLRERGPRGARISRRIRPAMADLLTWATDARALSPA